MFENQINRVDIQMGIPGNPAIGGEAVEGSSSEQQDQSSTGNGPEELLLGKSKDPRVEAEQVVADLGLGVEAEIGAYVRVNDAIESFERDAPSLNDFLAGLVEGRVLSTREFRMGLSSPKLSKLRQVGEHADLLRHPDILSLLKPGYTILYQVVALHGELRGDETARTEALARILSAAPGNELSREFLSDQTKLTKKVTQTVNGGKASRAPEPTAANFDRQNIIKNLIDAGTSVDDIAKRFGWKKVEIQNLVDAIRQGPASGDDEVATDNELTAVGTTLAGLIRVGATFDLLLLTPDEGELTRLREDYGEADALERCLPLHAVVGPDAVAVVSGRVSDLVVIQNLLQLCGFGRRPRIFLPRPPALPDVTDDDVIVAVARGEARLSSTKVAWFKGDDPIEPGSIAELLAPEASRRLHVFAPEALNGWTTVAGDDTWLEMPSL
jgi:hypothetical protein